jgi:hypothetical protein
MKNLLQSPIISNYQLMTCQAPQESSIRDNQLIVAYRALLIDMPPFAWVPTQATLQPTLSLHNFCAIYATSRSLHTSVYFTCVPLTSACNIRDNVCIYSSKCHLAWVPTQATFCRWSVILQITENLPSCRSLHPSQDFTCVPPHDAPFWPFLRSKCITYSGRSSRYFINIDYC